MKQLIKSLLEYAIANKESLVNIKGSGVHLSNLGYRVPLSAILPNTLYYDSASQDAVTEVVAESFPDVVWDPHFRWFTI